MRTFYLIFAGGAFLLFSGLQVKGVAFDANETAPKPSIYTSHGSGGGRSGGGYYSAGYFSSK